MNLRTTYGKLEPETLARLRLLQARADGIESKPSAYSRDEIEQMWLQKYRLFEDVAALYEIPAGAEWTIDVWTGHVVDREG